jgi:hypothetical protein
MPTTSIEGTAIDHLLASDVEGADAESTPEEDAQQRRLVTGIGAWGISIIIHVIVLLLLIFVVFLEAMVPEKAPIKVVQIEVPPPPEEVEVERDLIEQVQTEIVSEEVVDSPVVTELDLPVEEIETEDEVVAEVPNKGREDAVAASESGGAGAFMAIGAGGGAAGAFGNRNGGGRKRAVGRFGGSKASESAVEAALRWFARHQSPDGRWDLDAYPQNCTLAGPKCEPGRLDDSIAINKVKDRQAMADTAMSSYAILCFLGAGYDHKTPNKWRKVVGSALDWLVAQQRPDGLLGESNYEHPIAVMALAEAYGMTNDPRLREPTAKGVAVILSRQAQHDGYGLGWDYFVPNPKRNDSSVTGWNVMALKSAKAAGLDVGTGFDGAKRWLEGAWKATNSDWQQLDPYGRSAFPYTWDASNGSIKAKNGPEDLTCVGALCAVFLGYRQGDLLLETLGNTLIEEQLQTAWPLETYYLYYGTLAIFQLGGERWERWNTATRDLLVANQRKSDDCFDGSWDIGTRTTQQWGQRMLSTAYCCLSLEVYYRYLPIAVKGK